MRLVRFVATVVLSLLAIPLHSQQLEIHYVNVGWGDSVLVKGPTGITVLLEAGNTGMGTNRVVPYLKSIGIQPATAWITSSAGISTATISAASTR